MRIRTKLALLFSGIVTLIIICFSLTIYFFSASFREEQFYARLHSNAINTAKLLIEVNEVDTNLLRIIDENTRTLVNEQVLIYNHLNEVIYNSDQRITPNVSQEIFDNIRVDGELHYNQGNEEVLGLLYSDKYNRFVIISSAHDKYGLVKLKHLRNTLVIGSILSILIAWLAGWMYSGEVLQPISRIITKVRSISASRLHARIDEGNGTDELAQLAKTFNSMLESLEISFQVQRNFVSYASHELRTPLTALTAQLSVMLEQDRDKEYYKMTGESMLEDILQLSALSNGLLHLANASLDPSKLSMQILRADDILYQAAGDIAKTHPEYHIRIDFKKLPEKEGSLQVKGNIQLLKIAFANLIDNACKFSEDKRVDIEIDALDTSVKISFTDNGIGIPDRDREKILEPFVRGENVRGIKGHGLGLTLTNRIIKQHEGEIRIRTKENSGTRIEIKLPVATV